LSSAPTQRKVLPEQIMDPYLVEALAAQVDRAALSGETLTMLSAEHGELDLHSAYSIQRASIARRLGRGEKLCGMKMGLTSLAKMQQMGVHDPIYGHLTDAMILEPGGALSLSGLVHPRVEPEIAFTLKADLKGAPSPDEAMTAVGSVHCAIEVIDSRYTDFKFTLLDVIADNTSACRYIMGEGYAPDDLELGNLAMKMDVGGREHRAGTSAAILEHPARSLARLVAMLSRCDEGLKAGQTILAGAATAAVHIAAGDRVEVEVAGLGSVFFSVEG
jgi:2-keto-4-pentenoate hydratase